MQRLVLIALFSGVVLVFPRGASAEGVCDMALVKATYQSFSSEHLDHRLARMVTQSEYNEIRNDAGVSAIIYGVPVGANWHDFHQDAENFASDERESLTHDQQNNILWTGLDPNAATAYSACLQAQVFSARGLHVSVKSATETDINLQVSWTPIGDDPSRIHITWGYLTPLHHAHLPTELKPGVTPALVRRPARTATLTASYPGFGDSVTLEPLPIKIKPPNVIKACHLRMEDFIHVQADAGSPTNGNKNYYCSGMKPGEQVDAAVTGEFKIDGGGAWFDVSAILNGPDAEWGGAHACYPVGMSPDGCHGSDTMTAVPLAINVHSTVPNNGLVKLSIHVGRAEDTVGHNKALTAEPGATVTFTTP